MPPLILIVAGESSGDLHARKLADALKALRPGLKIAAVGGPLLAETVDEFIEDLTRHGVVGFWEPLLKIGLFAGLLGRLNRFMAEQRPAALVCVDYYGFNRFVLELARRRGIPAYYYVSPQVWASRPGRVRSLKRLIRRMFVIFPFEEEIYRRAGVPCLFVGHPLLDLLPPPRQPRPSPPDPLIGILPGSRRCEVARHLPVMLEALARIKALRPSARALVFAARSRPDEDYSQAANAGVEIVREEDYSRRRELDIALCSSGTATLENALLGVPMVVIYKMSRVSYHVARRLIQVPYIAMPNLLAGKPLVAELIQDDATAANIAEKAAALLADGGTASGELAALRRRLAPSDDRGSAAQRAAKVLLEEIA